MSRRSQAIRTARHAKLERRRLAAFVRPRNEKRLSVATQPFDCARQRDDVTLSRSRSLAGELDI